ncbi:MAG: hypothetical protein ACI835_005072 [Planctomycetota bacterium]|jgi:hypothetical protein
MISYRLPSFIALLLFASCGSGSIGLFSSASSGSSASNAVSQVSGFDLANVSGGASKVDPALIRFELTDGESDPAAVRLYYILEGEGEPGTPIIPVGLSRPDMVLGTATNGRQHELEWKFTDEGIFQDGSLTTGVTVWVEIGNATSPGTSNSLLVALGNDAPSVVSASGPAAGEASGNVDIAIELSDTGGDRLDIVVEFDDLGDSAGFQLARPAGTPQASPTPTFAFRNALVGEEGLSVVFVWDSLFDLPGKEVDIVFRVKVSDAVEPGVGAITDPFRIDNNQAPVAFLNNDQLLFNRDRRRGLPVAVELFDEEGDDVRFLLQWRRTNTEFPELPQSVAALEALMEDPDARRQSQICGEAPPTVCGFVGPLSGSGGDDMAIHLPELAHRSAQALAGGLEGRTIELLRPRRDYEVLSGSAASEAIDAVIEAGGESALLLHQTGSDAIVSRVELRSGASLTEVARVTGQALAFTVSPDASMLLVLTESQNFGSGSVTWAVSRIRASDGQVFESIGRSGDDASPIGLAAIASRRVFVTVDDELLELRMRVGAEPTLVLGGLSNPQEIALDPIHSEYLFLIEAGGTEAEGSVLEVDLRRQAARRMAITAEGELGPNPLPNPSKLAVRSEQGRIYVTCRTSLGDEVRSFHPRASGGAAVSLETSVEGVVESVAVGDDGTTLLITSGAGRGDQRDLVIAGGVRGRADVAIDLETPAYDPTTALVQLATPMVPTPRIGDPWRIDLPLRQAGIEEGANRRIFIWDSSEVVTSGNIILKLQAWDTDVSEPTTGQAPKEVLRGFGSEAQILLLGSKSSMDSALFVLSADLDSDGDEDLLLPCWSGNRLQWVEQLEGGKLAQAQDLLPGISPQPEAPRSVAAGDLDLDGDIDLVLANQFSDDIWIIYQDDLGQFDIDLDTDRLSDGSACRTTWVQLVDLDQNGLLDIVGACFGSARLLVYLQLVEGSFTALDDSDLLLAQVDGPNLTELLVADVNGDGLLDLMSADDRQLPGGGGVFLWLRNPGAQVDFLPAEQLSDGDNTLSSHSLSLSDYDSDGYRDLFVSCHKADTIAIFAGQDDGFASVPTIISTTHLARDPEVIRTGDLDRDGRLDFMFASTFDASHTPFLQDNSGQFQVNPSGSIETPGSDNTRCLDLRDFNGDGSLDLIATGEQDDQVFVREQIGRGRFKETALALGDPSRTINPRSADVGDYDNDGDLDIVTGNKATGDLTIFEQVGPGRFELAAGGVLTSSTFVTPEAVRFGDLDSDGDLDIVSCDGDVNGAGDLIGIFFQNEDHTFEHDPTQDILGGGAEGTATETLRPEELKLGDINGDGRLDIVTTNLDGNDITIFYQKTGAVPFSAAPDVRIESVVIGSDVEAVMRPVGLGLADVDKDGRMDVVATMKNAAATTRPKIVVFFQEEGGFGTGSDLSLGGNSLLVDRPDALAIADLDGNGLLDIVTTTNEGNSLIVCLQDAPRDFRDVFAVSGFDYRPNYVDVGDLDGDGDMDLIGVGPDHALIAWQESRGQFRVDADPIAIVEDGFSSITSVLVDDIDGDGDLDILTASRLLDAAVILFGDHN